ncbi:hypothetical protein [Novosphingobium sp. ZW T3_23]|uniref:hypothetical protein n=1 Tax=Novosphingobium sp. ZW T3_23 TaxID=3378084 RepID=UPI00385542F6
MAKGALIIVKISLALSLPSVDQTPLQAVRMNIAHDHETCKAGHASGRDGEAFMSIDPSMDRPMDWPIDWPIDWYALRSRLFAAHDLRAALDDTTAAAGLHRFGSFAGTVASVIHTYAPVSITVNPNASGNRKPAQANVLSVAGIPSTGVRG